MRRASIGREGGTNRNDAVETLNAAASVIASSENRVPQATKRRWGGWFRLYWCFGFPSQAKQIGHADVSPEPSSQQNLDLAAENQRQAPLVLQPFVAPPSSPASFIQSDPSSVTHSPAGMLSISANMYSPGGPNSIFAIGPYAHETQLVSPPVLSSFTTEPSTAPFTPPAESFHLTNPSSPEVPFAQLFGPNHRNGEGGPRFPLYNYDFPLYQFYPGSPVGQLISPSSGISGSGTSSPFPDGELSASGHYFLEFPLPDPPMLLDLDNLSAHQWSSQGSGTLTPDSVRPAANSLRMIPQIPDASSHRQLDSTSQDDQAGDDKLSLILAAKHASVMSASPSNATPKSPEIDKLHRDEECSNPGEQNVVVQLGDTSRDPPEKAATEIHEQPHHQKHRSITLGSLAEFNFDNSDGGDRASSSIPPDWWANGGVTAESEQKPIRKIGSNMVTGVETIQLLTRG